MSFHPLHWLCVVVTLAMIAVVITWAIGKSRNNLTGRK